MERDVIICRCEAVSLRQIQEAIAAGLHTPTQIKDRTRAGMGICQGRTCRAVVADLLVACGYAAGAAAPFSYRPPVRPIRLEDLAACPEAEEGHQGNGC